MNNKTIKQILFLTRPWQVDFHMELAKSLRVNIGDVPIRFITFFSEAKEKAKESGYECTYMPEELRKVTGNEITDERFAEIDRLLYESQGANFNLMLQSERFLPKDGNEAVIFGKKHLVVLDRLVSEGTLSISSMYDHFFYWLGGALANSRGGAHFAFVNCGLPPGRIISLRTPWETWNVPIEGDAEIILEECRNLMFTPAAQRIEYMKPQTIPPLIKRMRNSYIAMQYLEQDRRAGSYFTGRRLISIETIKNRLPNKWFQFQEPDYDVTSSDSLKTINGPKVFLPLHMEPEATILMYSPWLRDQIELCRLVGQALPVGWKLLVKENPKMRGMRSPDYYKKLKSIPNIMLVSPQVDSTQLIIASNTIVTLAGTASNEAVVLGKPSITLGRPPGRGMLSAGDLSTQLRLNDLFIKLQEDVFKLDLKAWEAWLAGTFTARQVPVYSAEGILATPQSEDNVTAFKNYIVNALKYAEYDVSM